MGTLGAGWHKEKRINWRCPDLIQKGSYTGADPERGQPLGKSKERKLVAVEGGKQAAAKSPPGKTPSGCLFPLPSQSLLLLRLQLQLQADTNGALIATGNLSGGGSQACRRCWGPGGTPPPGPLPCPSPHPAKSASHPCFGPHPLFHTFLCHPLLVFGRSLPELLRWDLSL